MTKRQYTSSLPGALGVLGQQMGSPHMGAYPHTGYPQLGGYPHTGGYPYTGYPHMGGYPPYGFHHHHHHTGYPYSMTGYPYTGYPQMTQPTLRDKK